MAIDTLPLRPPEPEARAVSAVRSRAHLLFYAGFGALGAGLLAYSQTLAFHWDEGFHLLAAQLIAAGKRPYLDFCFPQTPLNAYWNAAWIALFGPSWRATHVVATAATLIAIALLVDYLYGAFAEWNWAMPAAVVGLALFATHPIVWAVGTISQAYGVCLLLLVAAFRLAMAAVDRPRAGLSVLTGLLAGAAAGFSLLTAPAAPVLLIWLWVYNRAGSRWRKAAGFVAGATVACIPVVALFAKAPRIVLFNLVTYQTLYRRVGWPGATGHDIGILSNWLNSSTLLLLALLAIAGFFYLRPAPHHAQDRRMAGAPASGRVPGRRRAEFQLSLWLAAGLALQNALAHPTFPMYFVFLVPFLTAPGVLGFYAVLERLGDAKLKRRAVAGLVVVLALCLGNTIADSRGYYTWPELEEVAAKVRQVTPEGGAVFAPEQIYFLGRLAVPPGMEFYHAQRLGLPAAESAALHIVSQAEVDREIKAGAFATSVICEQEDRSNTVKAWDVYAQSTDVEDCTIFWQVKKKS